ncbi:MAG: hypothetical protein ACI8TL_001450 [Natronomonas sp.]
MILNVVTQAEYAEITIMRAILVIKQEFLSLMYVAVGIILALWLMLFADFVLVFILFDGEAQVKEGLVNSCRTPVELLGCGHEFARLSVLFRSCDPCPT